MKFIESPTARNTQKLTQTNITITFFQQKSQNTTKFLSSNKPKDEELILTPKEGILLEDNHLIQVTLGSDNFSRSDWRTVQYTRNWQRVNLPRCVMKSKKKGVSSMTPSFKTTSRCRPCWRSSRGACAPCQGIGPAD